MDIKTCSLGCQQRGRREDGGRDILGCVHVYIVMIMIDVYASLLAVLSEYIKYFRGNLPPC